jgi:hypothetical protein
VSYQPPTSAVGVLLVVENSAADGLPARVTAEQVRFGSSSVQASGPYFYGTNGSRQGIAKFLAKDGSFAGYLSSTDQGSHDPQLLGDQVYYLTRPSGCGEQVAAALADGTDAGTIAQPDKGYDISSYGVSQDSTKIAFFEMACRVSTSPQGRLVFADLSQHTRRAIDFPGSPPYVSSNPSWEPDGVHVDAIVWTGTRGYIARFDSTSTSSPTPRNACPGYDVNNGLPEALETDANGTIWFVTQTGPTVQVWKCAVASQTAVVAFTATDKGVQQGGAQDVDVSSDGSVLVVDSSSHVWEWNGSGDAHRLALAPRIGALSW